MICEPWAGLLECAREGVEPQGALLAHLRCCERCEERFERERALTGRFSTLRQAGYGARSKADRHADLMRRFQAVERPRRFVRWPAAVGIAAMLLAGVAVVGRWPAGSRVDFGETQPDSDGYTAVPYAVPLAAGEFVRVLHADLPPSGLAQMGLTVDGDAAEAIPVDLVVSEDGQPRAVRISEGDF